MTASGSSNVPGTVVVDASFWISTLLRKDSNHVAALNWLSAYLYDQGQLVAPQMLIPETAGAVARITQDKNLARTAIRNLYLFPFMRLVPVDHMLVDDAAELAITFSLKGADSLYVAVAKQLGVPLVTFDQEQLMRPASVINTIRP